MDTSQPPPQKNALSPLLLVILLVVLVGLVISTLRYTRTGIFNENQLSNIVSADDYVLGQPFIVKQAVLAQPGFVVLLAEGPISEDRRIVIEKSHWLPRGVARNLLLTSQGIRGQEEWMTPGLGLFVTIYYDDGDREFDFEKDELITSPGGDLVGQYIKIQ